MFEVTEGVVAVLTLSGLDEPPVPERFSTGIANLYFAQCGVDVAWGLMARDLHVRMMQQHRDNLTAPQQVTVDRIAPVDLGGTSVTEVVYYRSRPVPDLDNPGGIVGGHEATWQYTWLADAGESHAVLTIWRSGTDEISVLEDGFEEMRAKWRAGAALPGVLYDLRSATCGDQFVLTGTAVQAPELPWGQIKVPAFNDNADWQVMLNPPQLDAVTVTDAIEFNLPGMFAADRLSGEVVLLEAWLNEWSSFFGRFEIHLGHACAKFRDAVRQTDDESDPNAPLSLLNIVIDEESGDLQLAFLINWPDGGTHEGWVRLNSKGDVTETKVYW